MLKRLLLFSTITVTLFAGLHTLKAYANQGFDTVTIKAIPEVEPLYQPTVQNDSQADVNRRLFQELKLNGKIDFQLFDNAVKGYQTIGSKKREILTIIDFNKPSTAERLYVIDMKERSVLFISHVSHGRNSGANFATSFSNTPGSYQSSLGFFQTENTYQGRNGYSLVLNGLEKGINDRAKERAIVIHGAPYSNPSVISSLGRLGRSQGCPALPQAVSKAIIDAIKGGSILFIHAENPHYVSSSPILSNAADLQG